MRKTITYTRSKSTSNNHFFSFYDINSQSMSFFFFFFLQWAHNIHCNGSFTLPGKCIAKVITLLKLQYQLKGPSLTWLVALLVSDIIICNVTKKKKGQSHCTEKKKKQRKKVDSSQNRSIIYSLRMKHTRRFVLLEY